MRYFRGHILLFLILVAAPAVSQKTDSLFPTFNNSTLHDTTRLNALDELAANFLDSHPDSTLALAKKALAFAEKKGLEKYRASSLSLIGSANIVTGKNKEGLKIYAEALAIAEKINDKKLTGVCYSNMGVACYNMSDYEKALMYGQKALKIRLELNDKKNASANYNNIANVHLSLSHFKEALDCYFKCLAMVEELKDQKQIARAYNNIGTLYDRQNQFDKALQYYQKALVIREKIKDNFGLATTYENLGVLYQFQNKYEEALAYLYKALELQKQLNDPVGESYIYASLGDIYKNTGELDRAIDFHKRSLQLCEQISDKYGIAAAYNSLSMDLLLQKKNNEALDHAKKALAINKEINNRDGIRLCYQSLAAVYEALKDYKNALFFFDRYKNLSDSLFNIASSRELSEIKTNFEVEKRSAELEIKSTLEKEKLRALAAEAKKRQYIIIVSICGILAVVLTFSLFLYKRFRITTAQKRIIESQKHIVEEKNKEITDSITYAKRLQEAILPPKKFLNSNLAQNFVLYKPKDIVAGDFYWAEKIGDNFYIAAADSTGHGVPGAMVSVVCSNALNRSVKEFHLTETGKILDKTRELVLETFEKSDSDVKDGMDISLLRINQSTNEVSWSGANNPLWYVKEGQLFEIKADKQAVGKTEKSKPFTTHLLGQGKDTMFYLFTDGYPDQFGGPNGKKFKYKQLEELLFAGSNLHLEEQQQMLEYEFDKWKGTLEQVDDVCVIGIRL